MATILVIDDDVAVRVVLRKVLEISGHDVFEAANGLEGVQLFTLCDPALVVTDLLMPLQEGVTTIHQLRALNADVPIIAISGSYDSDSPLDDAMTGGANMRLAKPFRSYVDLISAVDVLLGQEGRAASPSEILPSVIDLEAGGDEVAIAGGV